MPEVKDRSGLVKQFDKAGIKMELADRPLMGMGGRNGEAFQLDISRPGEKNGPREIFRVWPGHAENRVEVLGVDSKLQQGVLMVKEPKRFLDIEIPILTVRAEQRRNENGWKEALALRNNTTPDKIVQKNGKWFLRQETPDTKRHYLFGMDERHYFVCQLPKPATTVNDAHRVLKDGSVVEREKKNPREVARQGEWFFLRPTDEEKALLDRELKANRVVVLRKVSIGAQTGFTLGRPHTADELAITGVKTGKTQKVQTRRALDPGEVVRIDEVPEVLRTVFIRGKVKHVEHKTVEFRDWVKVVRNTEIRERGPSFFNGIRWID